MSKTIVQKIVFKNTAPKVLYNLYMDAKLHSKLTGGPAKITSKVGNRFSAHGGYIKGKNLHLVKDKVIVQTWRGSDWSKTDEDSVFSLLFEQKGKDTVVHMSHAFVPDNQYADINTGWPTYYWNPWKQHLAGKKVTPPSM
jgi:activator of HSP90 ATPase